MKKNVLVTGGSGLVGSQFESNEFFEFIKINSKDCNLINKNETEFLFKTYKEKYDFKGLIHTAATVGGLGDNINRKGTFFYDNIMINTNVIESCRTNNIEKLVCFLSTCIFPDQIDYPLNEKKIHLGPPHDSNYAYAYAKRMADIQIRSYREQFGLNYVSVIPSNIYGPNDNFNIERGHVLPSLIHKCFIAEKNNTPLVLWGTGKPLREFIFSKDVAQLTEWILGNYNDEEPIILSNSEEISIDELVGIIISNMNFKGKVIWDKTKPDGQFRKPSDNSKLKKYLPDFKFTKIEDGIKKTIEWFYNNYDTIRK